MIGKLNIIQFRIFYCDYHPLFFERLAQHLVINHNINGKQFTIKTLLCILISERVTKHLLNNHHINSDKNQFKFHV